MLKLKFCNKAVACFMLVMGFRVLSCCKMSLILKFYGLTLVMIRRIKL